MRRNFLLKLFDLLYTRLSWAYDVTAWLASAGYWRRWTSTILPYIEAGPVLDVGCGRGWLLRTIADNRYEVIGIDRSIQMAQHARRTSGRPVLQGDGQALPFPDGHFATLITTFPAPYVLDPVTHLEFARVVRPGGLWLWVDVPALNPSASNALARLLHRLAHGRVAFEHIPPSLVKDPSGGLWEIQAERVPVDNSTVVLRRARRVAATPARAS